MTGPLLDHEDILKIRDAAVSAQIAHLRDGLRAGLDQRLVASLQRSDVPGEQILLDLDYLNQLGDKSDGDPPLTTWLSNAAALAAARRESAVFTEAISACRERMARRRDETSALDDATRAPAVRVTPVAPESVPLPKRGWVALATVSSMLLAITHHALPEHMRAWSTLLSTFLSITAIVSVHFFWKDRRLQVRLDRLFSAALVFCVASVVALFVLRAVIVEDVAFAGGRGSVAFVVGFGAKPCTPTCLDKTIADCIKILNFEASEVAWCFGPTRVRTGQILLMLVHALLSTSFTVLASLHAHRWAARSLPTGAGHVARELDP